MSISSTKVHRTRVCPHAPVIRLTFIRALSLEFSTTRPTMTDFGELAEGALYTTYAPTPILANLAFEPWVGATEEFFDLSMAPKER